MDEIVNHVANLGFPIAISIFLLVRIEGRLEGLTLSIHELAKSIEGLALKR